MVKNFQSWRIFDHIHTYDPAMNCWTEVNRMATSGKCEVLQIVVGYRSY